MTSCSLPLLAMVLGSGVVFAQAEAQPECAPPGVWSNILKQCIGSGAPAPEALAETGLPPAADLGPVPPPMEPAALRRRHLIEFAVTPLAAQLNGKFVMHLGSGLSAWVWPHERVGLFVGGGYSWLNEESAFSRELVEKLRVEAQASVSALTTWWLSGGVEGVPFFGDLAVFDGAPARLAVVARGAFGVIGRRHQLKPESVRTDGSTSPPTYGELEPRPAVSVALGLRVTVGERFVFRVEVQDTLAPALMERVNGCNVDDLREMDGTLRMGGDVGMATVSAGCDLSRFTGVVEGTDIRRSNDVPLALNLLRTPASEWVGNLQVVLGVGLTF